MAEPVREQLEASIASWKMSAQHEKSQAFHSLVIFGGGTALLGVGVISLAAGAPESIPALGFGGLMTWIGQASIRDEINSAMETQGVAAVREHQLEQLDAKQ